MTEERKIEILDMLIQSVRMGTSYGICNAVVIIYADREITPIEEDIIRNFLWDNRPLDRMKHYPFWFNYPSTVEGKNDRVEFLTKLKSIPL